MNKPVRKAVIAAAGFGTRFLPQTKAMPKEMLPLVDKPIIQQVVEELCSAGITDIVIVTGYHKRTIEDHFDKANSDLLANLRSAQKDDVITSVKAIAELANFAYIRQKGPTGNGTPVLDAAHYIGDEPFIYTYADDFIQASPPRFSQLIDVYNQRGGSVISCIEDDSPAGYKRYGYVGGDNISDILIDIKRIVEKPGTKEKAPSTLASVGGYVFEPSIIDFLQKQAETHDSSQGELTIQEAMQSAIEAGKHIYGMKVAGTFYDTGNPLSYLKTVFDFALQRPDIGDELAEYLKGRLL
ncbi:MAG TPA: sugar phosphate nucleotidyltransferase [Candidatus Saccharimonadales bacterium]|nr:sugar phosphate nucleotidyltransferase [Candidatus Saccharimonadales bacterium]